MLRAWQLQEVFELRPWQLGDGAERMMDDSILSVSIPTSATPAMPHPWPESGCRLQHLVAPILCASYGTLKVTLSE